MKLSRQSFTPRRIGFGALMFLVLLIFGIERVSGSPAPTFNVVEDAPPRWGEMDDLHRRATETLMELRKLPADQHQAYLEREWPTMDEDLVHWLREIHGFQGAVDSVVYKFGSAKRAEADDALGNRNEGYMTDELVALVYYRGSAEPKTVAIRCLNQFFVLEGAELNRIGASIPVTEFVIQPGEGLTRYVDYSTALSLAEQHGLKLYQGRDHVASAEIDADSAAKIDTDYHQVTVHVVAGDRFNLATGQFVPSPLRSGN